MKIAVTGAGGFLGTELLRQFSLKNDVTIYAFTFDFERSRSTYVQAENIISVDNSEAMNFDFSGIDVLINCAFPRNVSDESFADGLDFVYGVLQKSTDDGVGAVINISSQSVYSQSRENPADEKFPVILESKYAVGKYCSELFVNKACSRIRHTNLRMASLIGAGFNQRIVNRFAAKVINGEKIALTGGQQLFGFLDVRDAASGIIKVAMSECHWKSEYNLGTNSGFRLLEIAEKVVQKGRDFGFDETEIEVTDGGEWQNSSLLCESFITDFNWKPCFSLNDTIDSIYSDMLEK